MDSKQDILQLLNEGKIDKMAAIYSWRFSKLTSALGYRRVHRAIYG
jgi:hypothetical protein